MPSRRGVRRCQPAPIPSPAGTDGTQAASRRGNRHPAAGASAAPSANAAGCGTYGGPPAKIAYAIWGDTTELANQQKIVDAFTALDPTIRVKVTVADWDTYWDKLQTGLAGGDAPDVFVMDGPLFPDYQARTTCWTSAR